MPKIRNRTKQIIALACISFAVSLIIFLTGISGTFEYKAFDLFSKYLNPPHPSDNILIVQVDQQSIDALSKEGITWPWPRQMYAPIIEYLSEAEAVFMDILFTEPSSYGQEDDVILSKAIKKASNVYLPLFLTGQQRAITAEDEGFLKRLSVRDKISAPLSFNSVIVPIDTLRDAIRGTGNVTISPDEDGVYRRIPLIFQLKQHVIPHFVLSYLLQKRIVNIANGSLYAKDTTIPLTDGKLILRYYREKNPFPLFSFVDLLNSYIAGTKQKLQIIKKDLFKGKIVFIGLTAAGLYDLKPTSILSISSGALIHATTLSNIINKNFITKLHWIYVILFMLLICVFIAYSVLKHHSMYINLSIFIISLIVIVTIIASLFKNSLYINIIPPLVSLVFSFIISVAYSYAVEGKERLFIKRTFSQYMDKKIVDYLLQNPSLIKPGGQKRRVTAFFADIAGFTTIAEKHSPEDTAVILHRVLNSLTEVIIQNGGVVDKYIGDCIMAFWGAPVETDHDQVNACNAALQCIESLKELNNAFPKKGSPEIALRIGIHTGDAIAGNIGSDRLFNYTVIGDTVNLASRLESVNKVFKTKIIVSEDTINGTGNEFFARELGLIEVKGKTIPVKIFEIIGEEGRIPSEKREVVMPFNQGLTLYKEKKWHEALGVFDNILKQNIEDGPSEFYKKKCEYYIANPPLTENRDIVKMTEK
ncbi:MAG: adenylate/guanylate cyclase domain-containing protein [Proteobacteria bacterium]|nr:adenylate/guanylate cyclase domain-containing protein [Pseudomonadota bacterium]